MRPGARWVPGKRAKWTRPRPLSYWDLGPPPDDATAVIVVGYPQAAVRGWFRDVTLATRIDNGVGPDNEEQGSPVWVARDPVAPWEQLWPRLRRLG